MFLVSEQILQSELDYRREQMVSGRSATRLRREARSASRSPRRGRHLVGRRHQPARA